VLFVVYEAVALASALGVYLWLASVRRLPGAGAIATGIALTLMAAAVQVSDVSLHVVVPFDHNGLFHLVQIVALLVLASGLRRSYRVRQLDVREE